jgi:hypothetical protein
VLHWTSPTVFSIIAAIIAAAIAYLGLAALSRYTPFMEIIELAHTLRSNEAPPRIPGR